MRIIRKNIVFTVSMIMFVVVNSFAQEINLFEMKEQLFVQNSLINNNIPINQSVFVQQIGENNTNSILINFDSANINVRQEGNENDLSINKFGNNIIENVYQKGNNNLFYDYSALPINNANININQFGNDLSIYNSGSNSISNSLSITQKGSDQMLIILNN